MATERMTEEQILLWIEAILAYWRGELDGKGKRR